MEKNVWCIASDEVFGDKRAYLGWQNPAWDEDGYFWTFEEVLKEIQENNKTGHRFLFATRSDALRFLRSMRLKQRCHIVRVPWYSEVNANGCTV